MLMMKTRWKEAIKKTKTSWLENFLNIVCSLLWVELLTVQEILLKKILDFMFLRIFESFNSLTEVDDCQLSYFELKHIKYFQLSINQLLNATNSIISVVFPQKPAHLTSLLFHTFLHFQTFLQIQSAANKLRWKRAHHRMSADTKYTKKTTKSNQLATSNDGCLMS